ncbi:DUF6304 family protein [Elizabethkingia anophelis]|uniref:DUF6304 family protein n=1 Tax=Elizabethkingia anophelis TaxID=1117645 RepID=UPI00301B6FA5
MKEQIKYKGTYTDDFGTTAIIVENDFETLYAEIDGVKFSGSEFADLFIIDKSNYTDQQLKRFTFFSVPILNKSIVEEALCHCIFEIVVPQLIIDKTNNSEFYADLKIEYSLGIAKPNGGLEDEKVKLSLIIEDKFYTGTSGLIEGAFDQIRNQFEDKYQFKNCYGCMFGDYSVFGQSGFGTMLCFVTEKEKYKAITNKWEYMELPTNDVTNVQEIYYCNKYEIRKTGAGYRG